MTALDVPQVCYTSIQCPVCAALAAAVLLQTGAGRHQQATRSIFSSSLLAVSADNAAPATGILQGRRRRCCRFNSAPSDAAQFPGSLDFCCMAPSSAYTLICSHCLPQQQAPEGSPSVVWMQLLEAPEVQQLAIAAVLQAQNLNA